MNTPNIDRLDHATLRHLVNWLDWYVRDEDRAATCEAVERGLDYDAAAVDRGDTWQEIAARGA